MTEHYTHISEQFERKEMERLSRQSRGSLRREGVIESRTLAVVLQMDHGGIVRPAGMAQLKEATR
jgi:hypothetical protein